MRTPTFTSDEIREALYASCGNLALAAVALGVSRMTVFRLSARYMLRDYASELRRLVGCSHTGRPPNKAIRFQTLGFKPGGATI